MMRCFALPHGFNLSPVDFDLERVTLIHPQGLMLRHGEELSAMTHEDLDRRNFHRLAAAALSGMVAGAMLGCRSESDTPPDASDASLAESGESGGALSASDKNLCRGLNECKGQGTGGDNACRGQGECATYEHHSCAGENACKGQGGCGENPGLNSCKGQGGCAIPLMASAWDTVRQRKEAEWKAANQEFGEAPAKTE